MIREGYISIQNFLIGFGVISYFLIGCGGFDDPVLDWLSSHIYIYFICFYIFINVVIPIFYRGNDWQVAVPSCFLGTATGCGLIVCIIFPLSYKAFGLYIIVLSMFHFSEYLITVITNPANLSLDSFLLNHSVAYWVAAIFSWVEFFVEHWCLPYMKELWYITVVGVILCVTGEIIRKLAMLTARANFNHIVQTRKQEEHILVTWGIYRVFRHPSYVGWFWWSLGTQIILINPLCFVIYTITSWRFFRDRVQFEEMTLIKFFGEQYIRYKQQVCTGLPFISGYNITVLDHND